MRCLQASQVDEVQLQNTGVMIAEMTPEEMTGEIFAETTGETIAEISEEMIAEMTDVEKGRLQAQNAELDSSQDRNIETIVRETIPGQTTIVVTTIE